MNVDNLSERYNVRKLTPNDLIIILELCSKNEIYYKYHPHFATNESIIEDMKVLPPSKEGKDKFYIGYFEKGKLIAIMDLILGYPQDRIAYISFFMMSIEFQKKGIGTSIIEECLRYLSNIGFEKIRLAIDKGNPQSEFFWTKNNFIKTGEEYPNDISTYIPMERVF